MNQKTEQDIWGSYIGTPRDAGHFRRAAWCLQISKPFVKPASNHPKARGSVSAGACNVLNVQSAFGVRRRRIKRTVMRHSSLNVDEHSLREHGQIRRKVCRNKKTKSKHKKTTWASFTWVVIAKLRNGLRDDSIRGVHSQVVDLVLQLERLRNNGGVHIPCLSVTVNCKTELARRLQNCQRTTNWIHLAQNTQQVIRNLKTFERKII